MAVFNLEKTQSSLKLHGLKSSKISAFKWHSGAKKIKFGCDLAVK